MSEHSAPQMERLVENLDRNARAITSVAQVDARLSANEQALQRMYGTDLRANLETVDRFLENAAQRQPALAPLVTAFREQPYLLDPLDIDSLLQVAKHRAGRR